jgi:hypothetical protein
MAQQFLNELGLAGNQSMPINSTLIFSHPQMEEDLRVRSGANSIKWSYELNTISTPTVGGEVVQILSCFVGPITIEGTAAGYQTGATVNRGERPGWGPGTTTPTDEALNIVHWFLRYMHLAGALQGQDDRRNEAAIKFSYPARNWDFWIQVTQLNGFDFSSDQVLVPWSITAEILSDAGLDYFEAATMNTFTDSLTERTLLHKAISPGFDYANNPFINRALNDPGGAALSSRLGDNFQTLIASWSDSNFMTWGFHPFGNPGELMPEDPYTVWQRLLGGEFVGKPPTTDYLGISYDAATDGGGGGGGGETLPGQVLPEERWLEDVLRALGAPISQQNICFMRAWQAWEGGHTKNAAKYNWLNVTTPMKGSSSAGTSQSSIQKYSDYETGVAAQVKTITNGRYPNIVAGLREGNPLTDWDGVARDLHMWHTGREGGHDTYSNNIRRSAEQCIAKYAKPTGARAAILEYIVQAEGNEANWHYAFGGPHGRGGYISPTASNVQTDCSGYTTLCYMHAQKKGFAVPSIPAQSDAQGAMGKRVSGTYLVGDLCIYPNHVSIVASAGDARTATVSSHGQESGPKRYTGINYRGDLTHVVRILD